MGKLPWAKWYYADFTQDTDVLSNEATGGWTRILCRMFHYLEFEFTGNIEFWSRILRCKEIEAYRILMELKNNKICDVTKDHKDFTLMSRRLKREDKIRTDNRFRKRKERCHGEVTGEKLEAKKSEAKKPDNNPPISPQGEMFEEFINLYPNQVAIKEARLAWNQLFVPGHAKKTAQTKFIGPLTDDLFNTLITALKNQTKAKNSQLKAKQFVSCWPNPASWLRGFRWKDKIIIPESTDQKMTRELEALDREEAE